jgi:hypothetical protein
MSSSESSVSMHDLHARVSRIRDRVGKIRFDVTFAVSRPTRRVCGYEQSEEPAIDLRLYNGMLIASGCEADCIYRFHESVTEYGTVANTSLERFAESCVASPVGAGGRGWSQAAAIEWFRRELKGSCIDDVEYEAATTSVDIFCASESEALAVEWFANRADEFTLAEPVEGIRSIGMVLQDFVIFHHECILRAVEQYRIGRGG